MKILRLLFKDAQLNTSYVAHMVGVNYEPVLRHLTLVKRKGVVAERFWGDSFFQVARTLRAQAVVRLLEEWR
jgi:predicted ArsR family transcriptional regulator